MHGSPVDLGDVAGLDVPVRGRERRHLPLEVHLDAGHAVDEADVLEVAAAEASPRAAGTSRGRRPWCRRRARTRSGPRRARGRSSRPSAAPRPRRPACTSRACPGTAGSSTERPKPTSTHVSTEWWHDTSTDSLHSTCSISVTSVGVDDREDLGQAGVHARAVEGRAAALARRLDHLRLGAARRVRVVGVAVVAGDPVRGGDDVDAGLEDPLVEVDVGEHAVERHAVRLGGDDLLDGAGGDHADRVDARRSRRRRGRSCPGE